MNFWHFKKRSILLNKIGWGTDVINDNIHALTSIQARHIDRGGPCHLELLHDFLRKNTAFWSCVTFHHLFTQFIHLNEKAFWKMPGYQPPDCAFPCASHACDEYDMVYRMPPVFIAAMTKLELETA